MKEGPSFVSKEDDTLKEKVPNWKKGKKKTPDHHRIEGWGKGGVYSQEKFEKKKSGVTHFLS